MKTTRRPTLVQAFSGLVTVIAIATVMTWPDRRDGGQVSAQGNDPPNRVVFLHYDYMVAPGHSHAPDPRAIQIVVEAFRRHGITLHIDPVHSAIPERKVITLQPVNPSCAGPDAVDIHELRATYFQPHGNHTWHYAVFGHRVNCPDLDHCFACSHDSVCGGLPDPSSNGVAELPGQNFVVAFGPYIDAGQPVPLSLEATIFMHELGHNLGLRHGGTDACVNQKPNYISVMNYSYLLNGIPVGNVPGSTSFRTCTTEAQCGPPTVATGTCATPNACHCTDDLGPVLGGNICYRADYSDQELPTLNELVPSPGLGGLDENLGVSGGPDDTDLVLYFVSGPSKLVGPSYGPINWNNSDGFTEHVQADINNDGTFTLLTGFNDWAYLHAFLNTPGYRNGIVRQNPTAISCGTGR